MVKNVWMKFGKELPINIPLTAILECAYVDNHREHMLINGEFRTQGYMEIFTITVQSNIVDRMYGEWEVEIEMDDGTSMKYQGMNAVPINRNDIRIYTANIFHPDNPEEFQKAVEAQQAAMNQQNNSQIL